MSSYSPKDFFDVENPFSPKVLIDFKVGVKNNATIWQPIISGKGNNLFQKLTVTDASGYPQVELEMFDRDYSFLENIITRVMLYKNYRNIATKEISGAVIDSSSTKHLNCIINDREPQQEPGQGSDFRVKIGYYSNKSTTKWIDRGTSDNCKKTYYETDFMYFYIIDMKQAPTDVGLTMKITGTSLGETFLDKIQIVQEFSILHGKPEYFLDLFNNYVFDAAPINFKCEFKTPPKPFTTESKEIQISLGGADSKGSNFTKSITAILNEFCNQIPPKMYDESDNEIIDSEKEKVAYSLTYYYYIVPTTPDTQGKIIFDYRQKPSDQKEYRSYKVRTQDSIVKSFSTGDTLEFSALSMNFFTKSEGKVILDKTLLSYENSEPNPPVESNKSPNSTVTSVSSISDKDLSIFDDFPVIFAKEFKPNANSNEDINAITQNWVAKINREATCEGTIEIPGDPFYFFNAEIQPYAYSIEVIVPRPILENNNKNLTEDEKLNVFNYSVNSSKIIKSNLSGYYLIGSITHIIDKSGYTTTLNMRRDWSR